MNLEDYKIVIQFDKNEKLYWDVYKKGEPHFIGNNVSELVFMRTACEEVIEHIKRLQHEANKHQETRRTQNMWKPSDEQIEALESATENCAYSEYQDCLRELIKQLKKLKG